MCGEEFFFCVNMANLGWLIMSYFFVLIVGFGVGLS